MSDKAVHKFSIIHHYLSPNSAVTLEGHTVKRESKIWLQDPNGFSRWVQCIQYDNHFLFKDPEYDKGTIGRSAVRCSCGAFGVITGYNVYKQGQSPSTESTNPGEMLVCFNHATFLKHADGSS